MGLSRWFYLRREYRADISPILARWNDREDKDSALAGLPRYAEEIEKLKQWIAAGAPWFRQPKRNSPISLITSRKIKWYEVILFPVISI